MVEISWEGKYKDGKRVAPVRLTLPFQTVETVNESTVDRKRTLDLFSSGKPTEWRNRLIWGDKKYVLPSLLPELAGKMNLIYIDPPFDTGADFSFTREIPECDEELEKEPSIIEQKAYRDTWGRGLDSYLQWFYDTAVLFRELLAEDGSLYVHLDQHVSHYVKAVLDEVFGVGNFRNEIVWKRQTSSGYKGSSGFGRNHDTLFLYTKTDQYTYRNIYKPYSDEYIANQYNKVDDKGRKYRTHWVGTKTTEETISKYLETGRIVRRSDGSLEKRLYLDDQPGIAVDSIWTDIGALTHAGGERVNYPTQKPEALLERILSASSNAGDLVLDCFCGSGTTAAVAERLGRRWIACDLGRFAVHTSRKRLLNIPKVKPFVVQNLGKYERQAWMKAEFEHPEDRATMEASYRKFILDLYRADPIASSVWLHGLKAGRLVHVGAVDAPVTLADVKAIARDVWKVGGRGDASGVTAAADILGWEFAFELNETAKQQAAEARVDLKFRRIPREVLEKAAVDQGDIGAKDFFELRALATKVTKAKRAVTVELTDFIIPPEDLPADVAKTIKHWSQWIDYWAVDWDYRDDAFHNQWQSFRSREQPRLDLKAGFEYREPGKYEIVVKVIDILGNDTTKGIPVEVK